TPGKGLGFVISGGTDAPCLNYSPLIIVTRIIEGSIADIGHQL
ncbi:unnamed protein product, partial [Rotaria sp. Silwood1]